MLVCQRTSLKLKQRVKFRKKDKTLFMDVMLDLDEMRNLEPDVRTHTVGKHIVEAVQATLAKYSFAQFDSKRLLFDFEKWWQRQV